MPALIIEGRTTAMEIAALDLDLGETGGAGGGARPSGLDRAAPAVSRDRVLTLTANLPRCVIGLEACCGAHHLGRNPLALDAR